MNTLFNQTTRYLSHSFIKRIFKYGLCFLVFALHAAFAAPELASSDPANRFADITSVVLESPAFTAHAHLTNKPFTSDIEINSFIAKKIAPSPYVDWLRLGKSAGGADLNVLVFTQDGYSDPLSMAANRKPTVWVIAQQHGNEPAGAEAALELMHRLVQTDLRQVLDRINVVVMPRANPDGAASHQRETKNKGDMNRDHVFLGLQETQRLHAAMNRYPPSVVIDAHEFNPAGVWQTHFGVLESSDLLVHSSSHPDISGAIVRLSHDVFDPALNAAWQAHGISHFPYHTVTVNTPATGLGASHQQVQVSMGSHAAGFARNAMGLNNAVSYLIESRGIGLGKAHYQRRVASHVVSMVAILRTSALHADALRSAVREARKNTPLATQWLDDDASFAAATATQINIPMMKGGAGGADIHEHETKSPALSTATPPVLTLPVLTLPVQLSAHKPIANRVLPLAYVIPQSAVSPALQAKLHALGVVFSRTLFAQEFELENFTLSAVEPELSEFDSAQDSEHVFHLNTRTQRLKKTLDAGSLWVPLNYRQQFNWRIAAALFEPDSMGSLLSYASSYGAKGLFSTPQINMGGIASFANMPAIGQVLPVYRVMGGAKLIAPQLMEKE